MERIIIFIIISIIFAALLFTASLTIPSVKKYIRSNFYKLKVLWKIFINKKILLIYFSKGLNNSVMSSSYLTEIIFSMFKHFYDKYAKDLESMSFPKEYFNEDRIEILNMFIWITEIRPYNYKELKNLDWNTKEECFEYYNQKYKRLKFGIDKQGRLKIIPFLTSEIENLEDRFYKTISHIQNVLYDLDTAKARWILERRKHFMM